MIHRAWLPCRAFALFDPAIVFSPRDSFRDAKQRERIDCWKQKQREAKFLKKFSTAATTLRGH